MLVRGEINKNKKKAFVYLFLKIEKKNTIFKKLRQETKKIMRQKV
jgi:hypothetical protein